MSDPSDIIGFTVSGGQPVYRQPEPVTAVDDLAAWLTQIWDEDEEIARRAFQGPNEARYQDAGGPLRMNRWYPERVGQRVLRVQSGSPSTVPTKIVDMDPLLDRGIADHIVRHDPAAVLARIAADRQILELHSGAHDCQENRTGTYPSDWPEAASWGKPGGEWRHAVGEHFEDEPCPTVRLLALPHAGRPGYQEAWRPE